MMMLRRIVLAFVLLLAPSLTFAADCPNGPLITATGTANCTVPAGMTSVTMWEWGGGATGFSNGGGGGGFCKRTLTVTPAQTIYYHVAVTVSFSTGDLSWVNISSNAQPSSSAQGCYAAGGATAGSGGSGVFGDINFTGGTGYPATSGGGGGGAGSGPLGNGGNGGTSTGGIAGYPDGGAGGSSSFRNGTAPGGGGGVAGSNVGQGARGQIALVFTSSPTTTPFIFLPAVIP